MDNRQLESLLFAGGPGCRAAPLPGPPTRECLAMPLLEDMACGRTSGTPEQQSHVASCGFCTQMIELARVEAARPDPVPSPVRWFWPRFSVVAAMAACLVVGVGIGQVFPFRHSVLEVPERWTAQERDVPDEAERSSDTHRANRVTEYAGLCNDINALLERKPTVFVPQPEVGSIAELERENSELRKWVSEVIPLLNRLAVSLEKAMEEQNR